MPEYKLTYFDIKGLAEPIRLLFAYARVPYEDVRIPYNPLVPGIPADVKAKLPFGQVPILEFNGMVLSQSSTIGRFLATRFNLMGDTEIEAARIDEINDALRDYAEGWRALHFAKDEEAKATALKSIDEVTTPKYLGKINELLEDNGGDYIVGRRLSWADLLVYNFITYLDGLYKMDLTDEYPALRRLIVRVGNIPQISSWVARRPKTDF